MHRRLTAAAAAGAGTVFYGTVIERNAFTLRRFDVPVLDRGAQPLGVLHVPALHTPAGQRRKHAWIRGLAELRPDLVINPGDPLSSANAIPAVMRSLEP